MHPGLTAILTRLAALAVIPAEYAKGGVCDLPHCANRGDGWHQERPARGLEARLCHDLLQVSLRGRWRGNYHPRQLAAALRKLGFARQRRWHDGNGFQART